MSVPFRIRLVAFQIAFFCWIPIALCVWPTILVAQDVQQKHMSIVDDGKPIATIVVTNAATDDGSSGRRRRTKSADQMAAEVLVEWVRKITDAELTIVNTPPANGPVILIGQSAIESGLKLDDIDSQSNEGLKIQCDGKSRLLIAGQDDTSTVKAVCRLLEHWGCRYFVDHEIGEVYPRRKTLSLGKLNISEKPGFAYRRIWGSQWSGSSLWKTWNGAGGTPFATGHAWDGYVSKDLFEDHPEYFHQINGNRKPSGWYCTSNEELRTLFAKGVIESIRAGRKHPSISPPDGRAYCQCDQCQAQDDPQSKEPSSGSICVSNRYADFYQDVARQVRREFPDSILSFYCYADYTQAPTNGIKLEPNLCAWIAPIRYSRYHRIGHPLSASRQQLAELIEGWSNASANIGYRTYNYNLAECCVPFSKIAIWKHDIPYLKERGCVGINLETLTNWQIYGPHIYLSIRLAYDPAADADEIMEDYFNQFYGPRAGPIMKQYWMGIDDAFDKLDCESGSFFALHLVYTDEFLKVCRARINRAAELVKQNDTYKARVQMAAEGLKNAEQFSSIRQSMNRGEIEAAKRVYDHLLTRSEMHQSTKLGNHYTVNYLKRFLGAHIEAAANAVASPRQLILVAPDKWRLSYELKGEAQTDFQRVDFDDSSWREVATFSDTLDAQGLPDRQTDMYYRCQIDVPKPLKNPKLFVVEVDGDAMVYVNGKLVGNSEKRRKSFSVDVTNALKVGENTIAVRVDHSRMTELFLGGIIRPVLLTADE